MIYSIYYLFLLHCRQTTVDFARTIYSNRRTARELVG